MRRTANYYVMLLIAAYMPFNLSCHTEAHDAPEYSPHSSARSPQNPSSQANEAAVVLSRIQFEQELRRQQDNAHKVGCHEKYNPAGFSYPLAKASNQPGCTNPDRRCIAVPIVIQYMLTDSDEAMKWVVVEAFDNPLFLGNPAHRSVTPSFYNLIFEARINSTLHVAKGEYFLRAFTAKQSYGANLALGPGSIVGFYGAISRPIPYNVQVSSFFPEPCPDIAEIKVTEKIPEAIAD